MARKSHRRRRYPNGPSDSAKDSNHPVEATSSIPEAVAKAYERVQSLVEHQSSSSLEEIQGAVEYLLDKIRIARGNFPNATGGFQ